MARKESRGAHSRIDYPKLDEQVWGKQHNLVTREAEGMKLKQIPVDAISGELNALLAEEK